MLKKAALFTHRDVFQTHNDSVCKQGLYVLFYGHSNKTTKQNSWYSVLNGKYNEAKSLRLI